MLQLLQLLLAQLSSSKLWLNRLSRPPVDTGSQFTQLYTCPMAGVHPMSSLVVRSFALILCAALPAAAQQVDNTDDPPARAGRLSSILGAVSLQQAGSHDWTRPSLNFTLTGGDRIVTGTRSRAEIEIGSYAMRVADSTDVTIVALTDHLLQVSLANGTMRLSVFGIARDDSIEVDTPQGASIIRDAASCHLP